MERSEGETPARPTSAGVVADRVLMLVGDSHGSSNDNGTDTDLTDVAACLNTVGHLSTHARRQLDQHASPKDPVQRSSDGSRLWRCIDAQLKDCQTAVQAVGDLFTPHEQGAGDDAEEAPSDAARLPLSGEQLSEIRTTMRIRSAGLHMTLIAMSLVFVHTRGSQANSQTLRQELLVRMNLLQTLVEQGPTPTDLQTLMDNAMTISASLYSADVAQRPPTADSQRPSTGGSQSASANAFQKAPTSEPQRRCQVSDWIRDLENLRNSALTPQTKSTDSAMPDSVFSASVDDRDTVSTDTAPVNGSLAIFDSAELSEEDGDGFALEAVKQAFGAGQESFDRRDFHDANNMLQEALRLAQAVPVRQLTFCDTYELQYRLAVCACYTQSAEAAETALLSFTKLVPSTDMQRRQLCDIGHLLAQTYVRLGKIDMAHATCESSLKGRRMMLGKHDHAYYESLALLARICELQGRLAEAKVYVRMIPIELQKTFCRQYVGLGGAPGSPPQAFPEQSPRYESPQFGWQTPPEKPPIRAGPYPQTPPDFRTAYPSPQMTPPSSVHPAFRSQERGQRPDSPASSVRSIPYLRSIPLSPPEFPQSRPAFGHMHMMSSPAAGPPYAQSPSYHLRTTSLPESQYAGPYAFGIPPTHLPAFHQAVAQISPQLPYPGSPGLNQSQSSAAYSHPSALSTRPGDLASRRKWLDGLDILFGGDLVTYANSNDQSKSKRGSAPSALHLAALFGDVDRASILIGQGRSVTTLCNLPVDKARSIDKVTPLHFAIGARQDAMIRELISRGASLVSDKGSKNPAPPAYLLWNAWLDATEYREPNQVLGTLQVLLSRGWNVNAAIYHTMWTMLHFAAFLPQDKVTLRDAAVRYLLSEGADVNIQSTNGRMPLHIAANSNCTTETVQLLLAKDTSFINLADRSGDTPLHGAARHRATNQAKVSLDIIYTLCSAGADVSAVNKDNRTPLAIAEFYKDEQAVVLMRRYVQRSIDSSHTTIATGSSNSGSSRRFGNFTAMLSRSK